MTTTRSSVPRACSSARLIAWTMSASATGRLDVGVERRNRHGLGLLDGAVDPRQRVSRGFVLGVVVPESPTFEIAAHARQWVAPAPLFYLRCRLVAARVIRCSVRSDAVRQRFHKDRPLTAARALDRPVAHCV